MQSSLQVLGQWHVCLVFFPLSLVQHIGFNQAEEQISVWLELLAV